MGPPSFMRSVVDRNVGMWRMAVHTGAKQLRKQTKDTNTHGKCKHQLSTAKYSQVTVQLRYFEKNLRVFNISSVFRR